MAFPHPARCFVDATGHGRGFGNLLAKATVAEDR